MTLPDQREMLGIPPLNSRKQGVPEAAHLGTEFQRLLNQDLTADGADGLVQSAHDIAEVESRSGSLHQHAGVKRRIEQRKRPHHALNIHTMTDLEKAISY